MDYDKFIYDENKNQKENKKKNKSKKDKEIRFGIDTGQHDMDRFKRESMRFVEKGHTVKIVLRMKGRKDLQRSEMAELKILNFIDSIKDDVKVLDLPRRNSNNFITRIKKK